MLTTATTTTSRSFTTARLTTLAEQLAERADAYRDVNAAASLGLSVVYDRIAKQIPVRPVTPCALVILRVLEWEVVDEFLAELDEHS